MAERVKQPRAWRVSLASFAMVAVVLGGFGSVLSGALWWFGLVVVAALVLGVAAVVRALSSRAWLPTVVAGAFAFVLVELVSAFDTTVLGIPTFATVERWSSTWSYGVRSIQQQASPAVVDEGLIFILCVGVVVIVLLADAIAVALRRPAILGIILLPLALAPGLISRSGVDLVWLALTGIVFLALLAAGRPTHGRRVADAVGIAALAVVAALVVPLILPTPGGTPISGSTSGGSILNGVNPIVTLGDDLRREETRTALSYTTETGGSYYMRLTAMDSFTTTGWVASVESVDELTSPASAPGVVGLADDVAVDRELTVIEVDGLGGSWVPLPYPGYSVRGLRNDAHWQPETQSLRSDSRSIRGETYTVESLVVQPTPEQLQDAGSTVPASVAPFAQSDPAWPVNIGATAEFVTQAATSNYERAVALQAYLRGTGFRYSETAPVEAGYDGTSAEVISIFLDEKSGYCVHYASAMALMARTLGIPSRVAIGFLPGERVTDQVTGARYWEVTSDELHAWPELYFEGIGWVPFEPTTSRGVVPDYTRSSTTPPVPSETPTTGPEPSAPGPSGPAGERPDIDPDSGLGNPGGEAAAQSIPVVLLVALGILLLLLIPSMVRAGQRLSRLVSLRRPGATPALAWRELMQTAEDLQLPVSGDSTPRENAWLVQSALSGGEADAVGAMNPQLAELLAAVEAASFSRRVGTSPPSRAVLHAVLRELRRTAPAGRRWRADLWPSSIVRPILRFIA